MARDIVYIRESEHLGTELLPSERDMEGKSEFETLMVRVEIDLNGSKQRKESGERGIHQR